MTELIIAEQMITLGRITLGILISSIFLIGIVNIILFTMYLGLK